MPLQKVKDFPGLQHIATENIEKHSLEQQLREAQYDLDVQLHDLRSEFLHRENKLRDTYLVKSDADHDRGGRVSEAVPEYRRGHQEPYAARNGTWRCHTRKPPPDLS